MLSSGQKVRVKTSRTIRASLTPIVLTLRMIAAKLTCQIFPFTRRKIYFWEFGSGKWNRLSESVFCKCIKADW